MPYCQLHLYISHFSRHKKIRHPLPKSENQTPNSTPKSYSILYLPTQHPPVLRTKQPEQGHAPPQTLEKRRYLTKQALKAQAFKAPLSLVPLRFSRAQARLRGCMPLFGRPPADQLTFHSPSRTTPQASSANPYPYFHQ